MMKEHWKIKRSVEAILLNIESTIHQMGEIDGRPEDPFSGAGAEAIKHLDARKAYKQVLAELDEAEIERMIQSVNSRSWKEEEFSKVAAVLVTAAKKMATII